MEKGKEKERGSYVAYSMFFELIPKLKSPTASSGPGAGVVPLGTSDHFTATL